MLRFAVLGSSKKGSIAITGGGGEARRMPGAPGMPRDSWQVRPVPRSPTGPAKARRGGGGAKHTLIFQLAKLFNAPRESAGPRA